MIICCLSTSEKGHMANIIKLACLMSLRPKLSILLIIIAGYYDKCMIAQVLSCMQNLYQGVTFPGVRMSTKAWLSSPNLMNGYTLISRCLTKWKLKIWHVFTYTDYLMYQTSSSAVKFYHVSYNLAWYIVFRHINDNFNII